MFTGWHSHQWMLVAFGLSELYFKKIRKIATRLKYFNLKNLDYSTVPSPRKATRPRSSRYENGPAVSLSLFPKSHRMSQPRLGHPGTRRETAKQSKHEPGIKCWPFFLQVPHSGFVCVCAMDTFHSLQPCNIILLSYHLSPFSFRPLEVHTKLSLGSFFFFFLLLGVFSISPNSGGHLPADTGLDRTIAALDGKYLIAEEHCQWNAASSKSGWRKLNCELDEMNWKWK